MNKIIYSLVFLVLITTLESQQKSDTKEPLSAKKDNNSKLIQEKSRRVQECVCCGAPRDCVLDFDK